MKKLAIWIFLLFCNLGQFVVSQKPCPVQKTRNEDGQCVYLTDLDVYQGLHNIAFPPKIANAKCKNLEFSQGLGVCTDNFKESCHIWSFIATSYCGELGSLEFEKFWSKRCSVHIFHFTLYIKGNTCQFKNKFDDYPGLTLSQHDIWGSKTYAALYKVLVPTMAKDIDVLKIQSRSGVNDDLDGVQFTVLSDLFLHRQDILPKLHQIVYSASIQGETLVDTVGRESEHAWNIWASTQFLSNFMIVHSHSSAHQSPPYQYKALLDVVGIDPSSSVFHQTFLNLRFYQPSTRIKEMFRLQNEELKSFQPKLVESQRYPKLPEYCQVPPSSFASPSPLEELTAWVDTELKVRCHPTRLWVPCDRSRPYLPFLPCQEEARSTLAEDYANTRGWCDFKHPASQVPSLGIRWAAPPITTTMVSSASPPLPSARWHAGFSPALQQAQQCFQRLKRPPSNIRLAFFFTVFSDLKMVSRIFSRVYSPEHYYLFHVDAHERSDHFADELEKYLHNYLYLLPSTPTSIQSPQQARNAFVVREIPIVYGASTASMVMTMAMAWFHRYCSGWDYFVAITGSDYPLVSLDRLEKMLAFPLGNRPYTRRTSFTDLTSDSTSSSMSSKSSLDAFLFSWNGSGASLPTRPLLMAWTPGTSTHSFRMSKSYPFFEKDSFIQASLDATTQERGQVLGSYVMEYRSQNFGPPLFCEDQATFVHLDNRRNKSAAPLDSQWLFPRDLIATKGRAYTHEDPQEALPALMGDQVFRVWKKSDPATSGIYDRPSIDYMVESEEGRKYYHFFKYLLLGSEEHYYISLLYNWNRTKWAVQSLTAQSAWNTWERGQWEPSRGGFQTHTHFLTMEELPVMIGFARRGMILARKFSTRRTPQLLDAIDQQIHHLPIESNNELATGFSNRSMNNNPQDEDYVGPGEYWPGFYPVEMGLVGKQWVAWYRKNSSSTNFMKRAWRDYYMTQLGKAQAYMRSKSSSYDDWKKAWDSYSFPRSFSGAKTRDKYQPKEGLKIEAKKRFGNEKGEFASEPLVSRGRSFQSSDALDITMNK